MPDLGPFVGGLLELIGPLLSVAIRAFLLTALGLGALAACGGALAWQYAAPGGAVRGVAAVLVVGFFYVGLSLVLGVKRAIAKAIIAALERGKLGQRAASQIFATLGAGDETGAVGRVAAHVPLRQTEERLRQATARLIGEDDGARGLRASLRRILLRRIGVAVERVTLTELRAGSSADGVDLGTIRDRLAGTVDARVIAVVKAQDARISVVLLLAATVAAGVLVLGVARLGA